MSALINSFTLIRTSFSLPTRLALVVDIMSCSVDWPKEIYKKGVLSTREAVIKEDCEGVRINDWLSGVG